MTNTGLMNLDTDVVLVRVFDGLLDQRFAITESNLENGRRRSPKNRL
jgi:hypothetical protein